MRRQHHSTSRTPSNTSYSCAACSTNYCSLCNACTIGGQASRVDKVQRITAHVGIGIDAARQPDRVTLNVAPPRHPSAVVAGVFLRRDGGFRSEVEGGLPGCGNFSPGTHSAARAHAREACVLGRSQRLRKEAGAAVAGAWARSARVEPVLDEALQEVAGGLVDAQGLGVVPGVPAPVRQRHAVQHLGQGARLAEGRPGLGCSP